MPLVAKDSFFQMRATDEEKAEWAECAKADDCRTVAEWFRKLARERKRAQAKKAEKQTS